MRTTMAAGAAMLCVLATGASARATDDFSTAWSTCESGRAAARHTEAADACWSAFEAGMKKRDYAAAFAAAAKGCEKYGRADYCAFMTQMPKPAARGAVVKVGTQQAELGKNLVRAASLVHPVDVEDAESGYYMKRSAR